MLGPLLSHAAGRRQASLGTLVPRTPTNMFLDYGGDKRFVVKSYVDASFDTNLDDSKSRSGYILKVGAIS